MTIYPILIAPEDCLRAEAVPLDAVDAEIQKLMDDMLETMHNAQGIGLAAPQIGISKRVIVCDVSADKEAPQPLKMANPELVWASEETQASEEGCLSLPGQSAEVTRPTKVRVKYLDESGNAQEIEADGLLAVCLQHEIDHLNGVLFIDYLSRLKREMIMKRVRKIKKSLPNSDCPSCGTDCQAESCL